MEQYGGNPDCIIATPEIEVIPISSEVDFFLLASDGIFDRLDNKQINMIVQNETLKKVKNLDQRCRPSSFENMSNCCGAAVNGVMRAAMN
jgi:serine/threonine protein phosphatase PrpC